jgi:hypothetical protein
METLAILKSKELNLVEEKNAFLFSYCHDQVCSICFLYIYSNDNQYLLYERVVELLNISCFNSESKCGIVSW